MSYQVIARKWRPQSFDELKGQSTIRRTLFNAINSNRLHHALLFTGPRGTGKTSTARIIAKILRCTNLKDDHVPCDLCQDCLQVSMGRNLDVLEIDGASNNGVDSIRELREQVNFNPSSGNKKIYIIDEVHMLSTSAFNALLKTLEEPPQGVYFIMATTEVHKLPKTILSRCQRYNFKPVALSEVVELLEKICASESIEYDDEALFSIAQAGEGSIRDSLSFLDQCITFSEGRITTEAVRENTGVMDVSFFKSVLRALILKNSRDLVNEISKVKNKNIEPQVFLEELVLHVKNIILFKVEPEALSKNEIFSESQIKAYLELCKIIDLEDLYILFDICFKGTVDLVKSFNPLVLLEITLLKAGTAPYYSELISGESEVENIEKAKPLRIDKQQVESVKEPLRISKEQPQEVKSSAKTSGWKSFVGKVKALNPVVGSKLEMCEYSYSAKDKILKIKEGKRHQFLQEQVSSPDFLKTVQNYVVSFWGEGVDVKYQEDSSEKNTELKISVQDQKEKEKVEVLEKSKEDVENSSVIKAMKSKYKVEILEIKNHKK